MLCAEEGDGAEARGGRTPQPGSAHSSAGVLLPHSSWLKRFHAPPPPYPRNRCIHPSPPPPPLPSAAPFPHLVSSGGQRTYSCSPGIAGLQPHGLPAPRMPPPPAHAVPAAPGCPPLSALPFLPYAWLWLSLGGGAGPGLPLPIDPKGRAGHRGAGGAAEEGRGAGRGPGNALGGGHGCPLCPTAVPPQPLVIVVLYYFVLLGLLPSIPPPPPLVLLWGAVDGSVDPQRGPPGGV